MIPDLTLTGHAPLGWCRCWRMFSSEFARWTEGLHDRSNMARDGPHFEGPRIPGPHAQDCAARVSGYAGKSRAWCLHRPEADVTHFEMLTFWDDTDAIKRFAGDDFSMAKYYDFDSDYLIEKEAGVRHYEVSSQASPPSLPNG